MKLKKTMLLFLVCFLLYFPDIEAQQTIVKKSYAQQDGFKGKVKQFSHNVFEAVIRNDSITAGQRPVDYGPGCKYIMKYDTSGNGLTQYIYRDCFTISGKETYIYDDKANLIQTNYYGSDTTSLFFTITYKYDKQGLLIEEKWIDFVVDLNLTYDYDKNGNMIEKKSYDKNGILESTDKLKYDGQGNIVEEVYYDQKHKLRNTRKYKFDQNNNRIELNYYDAEGVLDPQYTEIWTYEYDKTGNWIRRISFAIDKPTYVCIRLIEYY